MSASHFQMSVQQLQNLLTTAMIPTIIFHGNYILCQQKAAGKRPCPPKESHSQAFSEENRTAAGWLSGESRSTGAEGERKRKFLNLSGKRTVNEYSDSRYLICFLCMAISMYRLQTALSLHTCIRFTGVLFSCGPFYFLGGELWNLSQTL